MDAIDKLLFNVQTISKIPRGSKIGTSKEFIIIEDESPIQWIWRTKNADSRERAITAICREIRTLITITKTLMESRFLIPTEKSQDQYDRRVNLLKKIRKTLLDSINGIDNLSETYSNDANVSGNLKPLITEISAISADIHQLMETLDEPL